MGYVSTATIGNTKIEYLTDENGHATIVDSRKVGSRLIIPETLGDAVVTKIEKKAFLGSRLLSEVVIPKTVETIGDYAFASCTILKKVVCLCETVTFGNGAFADCNNISDVCLGYEDSDDVSAIYGTIIHRLKAPHLMGEHPGSKSWMAKWDMELSVYLRSKDDEDYTYYVLCGEEDVELSQKEYESARRCNKAALCFIRLMHPVFLEKETEAILINYLLEHNKGCATEEAWQTLVKEFAEEVSYFELFEKIGGITSENIDDMLHDMDGDTTESKVYLLNYKNDNLDKSSVFDMFEL